MTFNRIQSNQSEEIRVTALDSNGDFLTGLGTVSGTNPVLIEIQRNSDGFYFDFNDLTFKNSGWTTRQEQMTEVNATYSPGTYYYIFSTIAEDVYYFRVTCDDASNSPWEGELKVGEFVDFIDVAISSRSSHSADDIWTSDVSGTGRTLTDYGNLVSDIVTGVWASGTRTLTSFGTLVADVWSYVTRELTGIGSSGISSETNASTNKTDIITEINANEVKIDALPTASEIADQVWDENLGDHLDSGTTGEALENADSTSNPDDIALAVWTFNDSGIGRTLTDFGTLISDIWSYITRTLTGIGSSGIASESNATSNTSSIISEINANESKIDIIDTNVDSILTDTNEIQGKLPDNNIMGSSVKTDKDDEIDAIKAKTDNLPSDPTSESNATTNKNSIITEINSNETKIDTIISDIDLLPTASENADAIWDENLADHLDSGTTGEALDNADSINDVNAIASAVWAYSTRSLTTFGTLVSDITTSIWSAGTRTLTSFGTLIADIWSYVTRELTGIGSSGIASESNATANTTTITTEINANEAKIDTLTSSVTAHRTAVESKIVDILGLVQSNTVISNQTYDVNNNLTSATIKIYPTATDANNDTNIIKTFNMSATYDGNGLLNNYKVIEV